MSETAEHASVCGRRSVGRSVVRSVVGEGDLGDKKRTHEVTGRGRTLEDRK